MSDVLFKVKRDAVHSTVPNRRKCSAAQTVSKKVECCTWRTVPGKESRCAGNTVPSIEECYTWHNHGMFQ
jgi:hypothetical protein